MTGGPPIPVCRGVTALRHAAVLGGNRRKPGREVPCGAQLRVSRQWRVCGHRHAGARRR